jgi:predicted O-methyltransferase YrrM
VRRIRDLSHDAAKFLPTEFDFIFLDGDHSLAGIARDWNDWAPRVEAGGVFAQHDTRVPEHDPTVAGLGSYQYFESRIRVDPRFELLEQVDSLSLFAPTCLTCETYARVGSRLA